MQEFLDASGVAIAKLQLLEIFDSVRITLDSVPLEFPETENGIVVALSLSQRYFFLSLLIYTWFLMATSLA